MQKEYQIKPDKLNEIARHATLKSASTLSKYFDVPIGIDIIPTQVKQLNEIRTMMTSHRNIIASSMPLGGKVNGTSLFIFTEESALAVCDKILPSTDSVFRQFTQIEQSALSQVRNVIIDNFLTVFSTPLQIEIEKVQVPEFYKTDFSNFFESSLAPLDKKIEEGQVINIAFHFKNLKIFGLAIFLFHEKEVNEVFKKLLMAKDYA